MSTKLTCEQVLLNIINDQLSMIDGYIGWCASKLQYQDRKQLEDASSDAIAQALRAASDCWDELDVRDWVVEIDIARQIADQVALVDNVNCQIARQRLLEAADQLDRLVNIANRVVLT